MDIASDELAEFRSELRGASPVLLEQLRGLVLCFADRTIADELVTRTVEEIDIALAYSTQGWTVN